MEVIGARWDAWGGLKFGVTWYDKHDHGIGIVGFYVPLDTLQIILETVSPGSDDPTNSVIALKYDG